MNKQMHRARGVIGAVAAFASLTILSACDVKNELLQPQNPGIVDNSAVATAAAAAALRVGALGRWRQMAVAQSGETLWPEIGHMADEFMNADFQPDRNDVDQRTMSSNSPYANYPVITQARGFVRDAITAEATFEAAKTTDIAELWMVLAHIEMSLAENFCNGIPLGSNKAGIVDYSTAEFKPRTNKEVLDVALTHLDTAAAVLGTGTDAASTFVRQAITVIRARILMDEGQFAAGAALVPTGTIPTTYQYLWTTSTGSTSDDNAVWILNNSVSRVSVADANVVYQGKTYTTLNAIPFASANDVRVPVVTGASQKLVAEDGLTPLFLQQLWKGRDDPIPVVSGIDARLIEAEGKLQANDFAGMMTILNALRAAGPSIGNYKVPVMAALTDPTPTTKDAAATLFFKEKAFWTFGRGQRLNDMRRLVRQYGRTQDKVFPSGSHYKGGTYGSDVNFPVPDGERVNPQFTGCIDRNA